MLSFGYRINRMRTNKENSKLNIKIALKPAKIVEKNKKKKTRVNYEPLQMENAIETVNAETMNVTEAAEVFNVP